MFFPKAKKPTQNLPEFPACSFWLSSPRRRKSRTAAEIWLAAENREFELFVSAITPVNLYYIARKLKGDIEARKAVRGLLAVCQIAITDRAVLLHALTLPLKDYKMRSKSRVRVLNLWM
ncbi:MAG: hypothetical protein EYC68_17690 [Chloroflexota bacterium]|nr:MAG: hypothetical protein EYC68_17690 [Chloroflexota bacterium]